MYASLSYLIWQARKPFIAKHHTHLKKKMKFPLNRKIVLPLVAALIIIGLSAVSLAVIYNMWTIPTAGRIRTYGVGIYWDSTCNEAVTSLDWGIAEPGRTQNVTFYLRNEGNAPITIYLDTENWLPQAATNYITLTWDYNGASIHPNQAIQVTLTLSISSSIEGITNFAFDIIISQS